MKKTLFVSIGIAGALMAGTALYADQTPFAVSGDGTLMPFLASAQGSLTLDYDTNATLDASQVNVRASTSGRLMTEQDTMANSVSTNATGTVQSDEEANFKIESGDVTLSTEANTLLISEISQVRSGSDLQAFVKWLFTRDPMLIKVESKDDRISVTREAPAKLFGFIPVSSSETVEVISWGDGLSQVNVDRPWWGFLSKNTINKDSLAQDVESRVNAFPSAEFKTILDASTKAKIVGEVNAAFMDEEASSSSIISTP